MSLLKGLPRPPPGNSGWPWTEESPLMFSKGSKGSSLPKISIVTPSYNQGDFLEETIRSILLQDYPNIEYIIIDGGSTDNSISIIKTYEQWLTYWQSEKDAGQADAINRGFSKATGDLVGWVNSDDYLLPNCLNTVVDLYLQNDDAVAWVGACDERDRNGRFIRTFYPNVGNKKDFADWYKNAYISQPSCFFRLDTFQKIGGLNNNLNFVLDVELWMKMSAVGTFATTDKTLSVSRIYPEIKSYQDAAMREAEHIAICIACGERDVAKLRLNRYRLSSLSELMLNMAWWSIPILLFKKVCRYLGRVLN